MMFEFAEPGETIGTTGSIYQVNKLKPPEL